MEDLWKFLELREIVHGTYKACTYYKSECKEDQKLHLTLRKKGKKPLWQAIRAAWHTRRHHIQLQTFIVPSPYSPVSLVLPSFLPAS